MPANEPILWTITLSLKAALESIVAGATYFNTASPVVYRTNETQEFDRGTFVLSLQSASREAEETQGKYYWRATFDVSAIVTPTTNDIQDALRVWSDIHTAVMVDPTRTVSGTRYAIDTQVLAPNFQDGYDERTGITCQIEVYYRHNLTNPTSL